MPVGCWSVYRTVQMMDLTRYETDWSALPPLWYMETLLYYDGPVVTLYETRDGSLYIECVSDMEPQRWRYLIFPVTQEELAQWRKEYETCAPTNVLRDIATSRGCLVTDDRERIYQVDKFIVEMVIWPA